MSDEKAEQILELRKEVRDLKKQNNTLFVFYLVSLIASIILLGLLLTCSYPKSSGDYNCIPKGYSGVYYPLDKEQPNTAIVVLDLTDNNQYSLVLQLDQYFKNIQKQKGGSS